jgi:hypothetical protein
MGGTSRPKAMISIPFFLSFFFLLWRNTVNASNFGPHGNFGAFFRRVHYQ